MNTNKISSTRANDSFVQRPCPKIDVITSKDKYLLEEAINIWRPNSQNYEDSWGYIIQATRHEGFRWYEPESTSLVFFGRKSEKDKSLVVVNFFATPQSLENIIRTVQSELNASRTILKNINPAIADIFFRFGFRPYNKHEQWDSSARYDDQTYPEQIIDLEKLSNLKGTGYHQLRKVLRKPSSVFIRPYRIYDKDNVLKVFAERDEADNKTSKKEQHLSIYYESHVMYPDADVDKYVAIDKKTNELIGFMALSDISSKTLAFVASIFKPQTKNARVFCEYNILLQKHNNGYRLVNLGGSEFKGDYQFKLWTFRPVEEIKKTHLIYQKNGS